MCEAVELGVLDELGVFDELGDDDGVAVPIVTVVEVEPSCATRKEGWGGCKRAKHTSRSD